MQRRHEDDPVFRDFIECVSVSTEELAAIVSMPDSSIREIKQHLRGGHENDRSTS